MYQMVFMILNNLEDCTPILDAWESLGVGGITILESSGLGSVRKKIGMRGDLPPMPMLSDFLRRSEHRHRTLLTVVDNDALVEQIIEATEKVLGSLEDANNGILFVLPVARAVGVKGGQARSAQRLQERK